MRTRLPQEIEDWIAAIPDGITQANIGYNYYSNSELERVLVECVPYYFSDAMLQITCEFVGSTEWDIADTGKAIDLRHSKDGRICYAILKKANASSFVTIFGNEWIGASDDKLLFRYVFKWFGNGPRPGNVMAIGVLTSNYDKGSQAMNLALGGCRNSFSWIYRDHSESFMVHNNRGINWMSLTDITVAKNGVQNELKENENEDEMYFTMQLDLVQNVVSFSGTGMKHIPEMSFSIQNVQKPFRIGLSLLTKATNGIGLGIVKVV